MEKLIFLFVLVVITWLHNWWTKRQAKNDGQSLPRRPPAAAPPKQPQRWEEELRRLLQGDVPAPPAPPAPPPLPTVRAPPRAPVRRPAPVPGTDPDMEKGLPVQLPTLKQSAQAYLRGSQLPARVALRMKSVDEQVTAPKKARAGKEVSAEIRQAIGLVRQRTSQRAAIIASVVLGPPKALED